MLSTHLSLLSALSLAGSSLAAGIQDWQSRSIYQVVTDRFAHTDGSGGPCDSPSRLYCNGTWQGIINKLDYIQGMGFDAVWISPVMENIDVTTAYGQAYHGYWPQNWNALNPHFGTADDLKALSTALHSRGMYLMVDIVVNHIAATAAPPSLQYSDYTPFSSANDYHSPFCYITDYTNQTMVERCTIGDDKVPLVDINTEADNVVTFFNSWVQSLVQTYSIDGLRIDTVKHVRKDFWPAFAKASGVYTLGEVLDEKFDYTGDYTNYMDAVFNYPEWFALTSTFNGSSSNMDVVVQSVNKTKQYFAGGGLHSTSSFSENHDNPRLPSQIKDHTLIKSIITWTFGGNGIPTWYYGQEAYYDGGADPLNREALWFTSYTTDLELYKHAKKLNAARKLAINDKYGNFTGTSHVIAASTQNHIALLKYPLLTILTNLGNSSAATAWSIPKSGFKAGTEMINIAIDSCDSVTVGNDESLAITFQAGQPQVYLPAVSLTSSGGVCPDKAKTPTGSVASTGSTSGAMERVTVASSVILSSVMAALALAVL